jgi:protein gp37
MSKIQWTEQTWNPINGCSKISAGCKNCYAIPMSHRLAHIPATAKKYAGITEKTEKGTINFTGKVSINDKALLEPLKRKKPTTYFVNSMGDLFHENVPFEWIDKVWAVMALCPQHTFQVLTKRPERMEAYLGYLEKDGLVCYDSNINKYYFLGVWGPNEHTGISEMKYRGFDPFEYDTELKVHKKIVFAGIFPLPNVWLGTSVENQEQAEKRILHLLACPAAVRFLSCEPLLEKIDLNPYVSLSDYTEWKSPIDWVIVGGESGRGARPMHPEWVRSLRNQCKESNVPFFFKQWGEWVKPSQMPDEIYSAIEEVGDGIGISDVERKLGKHASGRLLDGVEYNEMPNLVNNS